jgi:hypothetical protein
MIISTEVDVDRMGNILARRTSNGDGIRTRIP